MGPEDVKKLRERLGLSRKTFAAAIGVTEMTVGRWERGLTKPQPFCQKAMRELAQRSKEAA